MAVRAPGVTTLGAFEAQLRHARVSAGDPIAPLPWDVWLEDLAIHSPEAAKRARRVGRTADAGLRATLAVAIEAAAGAAGLSDRLGVVVAGSNLRDGEAWHAFEKFADEPTYLSPRHGFQAFDTHVMAAIAECVGALGPGLTVGGASASGNVAILTALDWIRSGRADACLVVGPLADLSPSVRHALHTMGAVADGADCRPFDRAAAGFVPGAICGALLMEAEASAAERGAVPLAEIAGASLLLGASHLPDPDAAGAARAMDAALRDGAATCDTLDLISAHATSTPAGDRAECEALRTVLGDRAREVPINATKSLIGHGLQAAGLVEVIALILEMRGGFIHGTAKLADAIASDLWLVGPDTLQRTVRRALSNAFGFGTISTSILVNMETAA